MAMEVFGSELGTMAWSTSTKEGRADAYLDGLTGVDVVALLEDREGDIWAVTAEGLESKQLALA